MDLFSISNHLDLQFWEKKGDIPNDFNKLGYKEYHVTRANFEGESLTYYLSTDNGDVKVATLNGLSGKIDPLKQINKCYLLIEEDPNIELNDKKVPGRITGIAVDDDWVEYKR
ncbi:uncharacterized protein LOC135692638 [Rhopilema esculentum]|uniref:uncharacterized protein LOC135692638 n=1 Tax=Rhopilema esculentum TaxID=499914 RepID=UPI0031D2F0A4